MGWVLSKLCLVLLYLSLVSIIRGCQSRMCFTYRVNIKKSRLAPFTSNSSVRIGASPFASFMSFLNFGTILMRLGKNWAGPRLFIIFPKWLVVVMSFWAFSSSREVCFPENGAMIMSKLSMIINGINDCPRNECWWKRRYDHGKNQCIAVFFLQPFFSVSFNIGFVYCVIALHKHAMS